MSYGRFTDPDLKLIRSHFKGNEPLLKLIRKVFLPEITAGDLDERPLNGLIDVYASISPDKSAEEMAIDVKARNMLLSHLNVQLTQLQALADSEESEDERKERERKNSTK